jgi:GTP cyclohydrolase I
MVQFANLPSTGKEPIMNEECSASSSEQNASNGTMENGGVEGSKKRKRKSKGSKATGTVSRKRLSVSKPARDPRDEASPARQDAGVAGTRSPSPVIDFDGLSRPSTFHFHILQDIAFDSFVGRGTRERLDETPEQAAARLNKITGAVRTILECIGEDPDREGLLGTPERYAKAMLFFTKGYQENVRYIVNDSIFHEGHNELVIVKDIEVFSLCEHHMVPFTGKVSLAVL